MAYLRNKKATGECTVAVIYIACKLTMSRRTPRINSTNVADSGNENGLAVEHEVRLLSASRNLFVFRV